MNRQHRELADGRWNKLSFLGQMANVGSEVERALNWKKKKNFGYCQLSFERALELLDLTIENSAGFSRLKELLRVKEALVDHFFEMNYFMSSDESWRKYFLPFMLAARKNY